MKRFLVLSLILNLFQCLEAQSVGIYTTNPVSPLHVAALNPTFGDLITVENTFPLGTNVQSSIFFANGIETASNYKYTGAIKTIGYNTVTARLGLFTFANSTKGGLLERLSINDAGNVGIGITNPQHKLDVDGNAVIYGYLTTDSYADIGGDLTVLNGKGIVRSITTSQMKIKLTTAGQSWNNLAAGATALGGTLFFGENFNAVSVMIGQVIDGTGDWAKVLMVPFNVDVNTDSCQFQMTNVSGSPITFSANWEVILIGN